MFGVQVITLLGDVMLMIDVILQFDPSPYVFLFALAHTLAEILQVMFLFMRCACCLVAPGTLISHGVIFKIEGAPAKALQSDD